MPDRAFGPVGPRGEALGPRPRGPVQGQGEGAANREGSKESGHDIQDQKERRTGGASSDGPVAPTTPRGGAKEGHIDWASESLDDAMDYSAPPPVFGHVHSDGPPHEAPGKPSYSAEGSEGLPDDRPMLRGREPGFGEREHPAFYGPPPGREHPMPYQHRREYPMPGFVGPPHPGRGLGRGFPGPMMRPNMQYPGMHPGFIGRPIHGLHDPGMHLHRPLPPHLENAHPRPHAKPQKPPEPAHKPAENFRILKRAEEPKASEEGAAEGRSPSGKESGVAGLERDASGDGAGANGAVKVAAVEAPTGESKEAQRLRELDFDAQVCIFMQSILLSFVL